MSTIQLKDRKTQHVLFKRQSRFNRNSNRVFSTHHTTQFEKKNYDANCQFCVRTMIATTLLMACNKTIWRCCWDWEIRLKLQLIQNEEKKKRIRLERGEIVKTPRLKWKFTDFLIKRVFSAMFINFLISLENVVFLPN